MLFKTLMFNPLTNALEAVAYLLLCAVDFTPDQEENRTAVHVYFYSSSRAGIACVYFTKNCMIFI